MTKSLVTVIDRILKDAIILDDVERAGTKLQLQDFQKSDLVKKRRVLLSVAASAFLGVDAIIQLWTTYMQ